MARFLLFKQFVNITLMLGLEIIIFIVIFLFSVVFHELAHGYTAFALGDDTAKVAGRLTLNPIKHLDLLGSIIVPGVLILLSALGMGGIIFGWAKPVPYNPYKLKDPKYGSAKVAIAGSLANFSLALIFGLLLRFIPVISAIPGMDKVFLYIVQINLILGLFNLIPIPPLDGSKILFTFIKSRQIKEMFARYGLIIFFLVIYTALPLLLKLVGWLTLAIVGN
jgi:Zn-dependent protease